MITRLHPTQNKFTAQEAKEFRQMLRDKPNLKKEYQHFKSDSYQRIRSRAEGSPWLDKKLDMLFEIAAVSGIK